MKIKYIYQTVRSNKYCINTYAYIERNKIYNILEYHVPNTYVHSVTLHPVIKKKNFPVSFCTMENMVPFTIWNFFNCKNYCCLNKNIHISI